MAINKHWAVLAVVLFVFSLSGCSSYKQEPTRSSGSWVVEKAIRFKGILYAGSDEKVDKIQYKIGTIQTYSTNEKDDNSYSFSNYYSKGTKLYKIPNVSIKKAIAIEFKKGQYVKAACFPLRK